MSRMYARAQFSNPPVIKATIHVVYDSVMMEKEINIVIHDIGLQGLRFSSDTAFAIDDFIAMQISLFSPTNHICGKVIRKEHDQDSTTYNYGLKIVTADFDYYQFMHSYDTYIKEHQQTVPQ